jgi:hypothetical protein
MLLTEVNEVNRNRLEKKYYEEMWERSWQNSAFNENEDESESFESWLSKLPSEV